ncbi:MAG: DNA-formamidopyrimidine glycosylase [bacterium]|nr:DNA-formamidopyrimidine glycosylase [bacterium]
MPELPDLEYIQAGLAAALAGRSITAVSVKQPIVLRNLLNQPSPDGAAPTPRSIDGALLGLAFESVHRHGPFLRFHFTGSTSAAAVDLIVHPMLAGRFHLSEASAESSAAKTMKSTGKRAAKSKGPGAGLCLQLEFDDCVLSYLDTKKMGKIYATRPGETGGIPRYDDQGLSVLGSGFTRDAFFQLLEKRKRQQVRVFLMDQTNLSAIGNAYADEILFAAGIHPKTTGAQLDSEEITCLFGAIRDVLQAGIAAVRAAQQSIDIKVRDHMRVRNRRDEECFVCGSVIRRVAVLGHDAFFCPTCQPAKRDLFIDWRKS